jgi:uncharacterized membrane protein YjjP (DUF1212 family)
MSESPFDPPRAPLKDSRDPRKKRPNLLAIIIGALVDLFSTLITGVALEIVFGISMGAAGMNVNDLVQMLRASTVFSVASSMLGLSCSVLGGYVCARFANQNEYANGLAVGVLGIISGLLLTPAESMDAVTLLLAVATIPAALLGAHLKMRGDKNELAN